MSTIKVPYADTDKLAEICANLSRENIHFECSMSDHTWVIIIQEKR